MTKKKRLTGVLVSCIAVFLCIALWSVPVLAVQTGSNASASLGGGWKTGTYVHVLMTDTYDDSVIGEDTIQVKYTGTSSSDMKTLIYGTNGATRTLPGSDTVTHISGNSILPAGTNSGKFYTGTNVKTAMTHIPDPFNVEKPLNPTYYGRNLNVIIPPGYIPAGKSGSHTAADNPIWNSGTMNLFFADADPAYSASAQTIAASFVENAAMGGLLHAKISDTSYLRMNDTVLRLNVVPNRTTITFDGNGGTLTSGSEDRSLVYGHTETIDLPEDPTWESHVFLGWNTERNGSGERIDESSEVKTRFPAESEVTLYAQWAECGFSVAGGDTDFQSVRRVSIVPENGEAELLAALKDGQYILITGLEEGARYQVSEDGRKMVKPEYEVTEGSDGVISAADTANRGKSLATPEEEMTSARTYEFTNALDDESEGVTLKVNKVLAGSGITEADQNAPFTFRYYLQGLDPDLRYPVRVNETAENRAPAQDGTLEGTVTIKGGESFSIAGLPPGAKYCIQEVTDGIEPGYAVKYRVVNGAESVETVTDSGKYPLHGQLSTGQTGLETNRDTESGDLPLETIREDVDVEYEFINTKEEKHALHLRKVLLDGETPLQSDEEFSFDLEFRGLTSGETYSYVSELEGNKAFTADNRGSAKLTLHLSPAQDEVHFPQLDGSCTYTLTEQANPCSAEVVLTDEYGTVLASNSERSGRSVSISNEQELEGEEPEEADAEDEDEAAASVPVGFGCDHYITVKNVKEKEHDLTVTKRVTGQDLSAEQLEEPFTIRAEFTGLTPGETYIVEKTGKGLGAEPAPPAQEDPEEEENEEDEMPDEDFGTETMAMSADEHGRASLLMTVNDRTTYRFAGLKDGSRFTLTEEGTAGVRGQIRYRCGDGTDVTGQVSADVGTGEVVMDRDFELEIVNEYTNQALLTLPSLGSRRWLVASLGLFGILLFSLLWIRKRLREEG